VVASGTKVAIGNNIEEALDNLLSDKKAVEIELENTDTIEELIDAVIKANHNLYESSNTNNWEQIGKDITKLQDLVNKLEVLKEQEKKEEAEQKVDTDNEVDANVINENLNNIVNTIEGQ
jgi:uncharacterized membrane protein (UPF0182 family)